MIKSERFEWFESAEGLKGARLGAVCIDLLTRYDFYKTYLEFIKEGKNEAEAKILTSDKCRASYWTINRAVKWFESDDIPARSFKRSKRKMKPTNWRIPAQG